MQHMNWDDLRFFLAVARKGSIRGASELLKVNASTVSRRIDAFENKLSVRLFERLPTGYVLTHAGADMVDSSERIEDEVASLNRSVIGRDTRLTGTLRVTMPATLATHLLMPDFAEFGRLYPGIELEFAVSTEEFNLTKREADVAIRITDKPPEYLVGRHITTIAKAIYASPAYIAHHDTDKFPERMNWIGWEENERFPAWIKASEFPKSPIHHQSNDILVQLEAAKSGMGLAMLPCFMADPIAELRRVSPCSLGLCGDIWILTHKDLRSTARVRTFMAFMAKAFEKHKKALHGISSTAVQSGVPYTAHVHPQVSQ
ncbi:MAG: LysR family transcriptional regulator [Thiohalomonadales bacterium]